MPAEVQVQQMAVNSKATFEFYDDVAMYAAGINSFQLFYPDNNDHTVQQFGLTLQAQSSGNIVTVQNTAVLQNASGAQLDPSCSIWIGVVAWVGTVPGTLALFGPSEQINSGQQSSPINISNNMTAVGGLAGFNLQYSDDSYDVRGINASVGTQINGNQGYISVSDNMYDGNGNIAYNPTASGLLIAVPTSGATDNTGIIIKTANKVQNETGSLTVDMGQEVSDALCLITDFNVVYPNTDHYVLGVEAGPWVGQEQGNQVYVDGSQVVITGLRASMWNDDGDCQDDSQSYCSVLVIGIASS